MNATRISDAVTPFHVDPPLSPVNAAAHGAEYSDSVCRIGFPKPRGHARGIGPPAMPPPGPVPPAPPAGPGPSPAAPTDAASAPAVDETPRLNAETKDCSSWFGGVSGESSAVCDVSGGDWC